MIGVNCSISVKRATTTAGKTSYPSTYIFENVPAYKEQVQPELSPIFNEKSAFETWKFFVDYMDIRSGDKIFDDEGNEYKVEGVQKFKNREIESHIEVVTNHIYN
jgi:hypothetical protein